MAFDKSVSLLLSRSRLLFQSRSLVRSISWTGQVLKRQLWLWPILALISMVVLGWWVFSTVENQLKSQLAEQLRTLRDAQVATLSYWFRNQENIAQETAEIPEVASAVAALLQLKPEPEILRQSPAQTKLAELCKGVVENHGYTGFIVRDLEGFVRGANRPELLGVNYSNAAIDDAAHKVAKGQPTVSRPFKSIVVLRDESGRERADVPTMFALAPIKDKEGKVLAALGLRIRPEVEFTKILGTVQAGATGETYALDRFGRFMSQSRFDEKLKDIGLLVDDDKVKSILNLENRNPGVNLLNFERPKQRRRDQPLTRVAQAAAAGTSGVDVEGYRDYRGVPSIGAWAWMPDHDMAVIVEMDQEEGYRPLVTLRRVHWTLLGLLAFGAVVLQVFLVIVDRQQQALRRARVEGKQLGQYTLQEKLGQGGMGQVYKAKHAMLRRPVAVKLLDPDRTSPEAVARFEREVQMTSELAHPNTIAIYDYGRTPEGVFYYVMEYLDGLPLDKLVARHGVLPEGRVIHILAQVCGSLNEAHGIGLVHRDIKPANIILNRRGGQADVVKVLDFGLVKAMDNEKATALTAANAITGTPQYLSPEAIDRPDSVDSRSDLYAVGAVGYFLLTGKPVFEGASVVELIHRVSRDPVPSIASRRGSPVSHDLEAVLMRCLAKKPGDRFASADLLLDALLACQAAGRWTRHDAEAWWREPPTPPAAIVETSAPPPAVGEQTLAYQPDATDVAAGTKAAS
jgi:hypothetical protein